MGIRRREDWGESGPLPPGGVVVLDDADAAAVLHLNAGAGTATPPLGLLGGDLCATLGGRRDEARLHSADATRVVVDAMEVRLDGGRPQHAVAHLVARRSWWRGQVIAVMNAAWLGTGARSRAAWNVAPRAHPGDGMLDVLDADLSLGDRCKARRRLPLGTHVPHPGITTFRTAAHTFVLDRPADVWLDGRRVGRARTIEVRVLIDALAVVV